MKKLTQKEKILAIVRLFGPIKTEQVEKIALQNYISGGSAGRYLRALQAEGLVYGVREWNFKTQKFNKTYTWYPVKKDNKSKNSNLPTDENQQDCSPFDDPVQEELF